MPETTIVDEAKAAREAIAAAMLAEETEVHEAKIAHGEDLKAIRKKYRDEITACKTAYKAALLAEDEED